jgi:hypothetical protein
MQVPPTLAHPGSRLARFREESARFPRDFRGLGRSLVLRRPEEDFAENPKKISPLDPELVLRQVPGKSAQRRGEPKRRRHRWRRRRHPLRRGAPRGRGSLAALHDAAGDEVARVGLPPRRLRPLPPLRLARRRRTRTLPIAHSGVRQKPSATDRAGALADHRPILAPPARSPPSRIPRRSASVPAALPQPRWTTSREQRRVTSRER